MSKSKFDHIEIKNAREYALNKKDSMYFFTLVYNDVQIYSCKVVDGKKGMFISFPSEKAKDGKFYNHAWVDLSDEEREYIIEEVIKQATDKE